MSTVSIKLTSHAPAVELAVLGETYTVQIDAPASVVSESIAEAHKLVCEAADRCGFLHDNVTTVDVSVRFEGGEQHA